MPELLRFCYIPQSKFKRTQNAIVKRIILHSVDVVGEGVGQRDVADLREAESFCMYLVWGHTSQEGRSGIRWDQDNCSKLALDRSYVKKAFAYYSGGIPNMICQTFSKTQPTPKLSVILVSKAHFRMRS